MKSNLSIIILCFSIFAVLGYLGYKKNFFKSNSLTSKIIKEGAKIQIQELDYEKMCLKFQYIEYEFKGEYGENLRIVTKCALTKEKIKFETFVIPFRHIFSFSPQSGEFTTEINTKIYLLNHQKKWSAVWDLIRFRFFNSATDQFKVSEAKLVLNLKSLSQVFENQP